MPEGHSTTRPPFFKGTNYPYWKARMEVFLRATDYDVWRVIQAGPHELPKDEAEWTRDQIKKSTVNYSAINMMQCAIHPEEYSRISACVSAKQMWDKLQTIYEGTSEVKETKANMLVTQYEMFRMKQDESISDMFARFMQLTNQLNSLGKVYSNSELVRKILRSLTPQWHTKATIVEDSKNLSTMPLDELIGSLMTYELNLKRNAENEKGKRPIALEAQGSRTHVSGETSSSSDSDDEGEFSMLARQFRKFLKKKNFRSKEKSNFRKFQHKHEPHFSRKKNDSELVCYNCRKPGHFKTECPEPIKSEEKKKYQRRKHKGMMATGAWDDEDSDTSPSSSNQSEKSIKSKKVNQAKCLMALNDDQDEVSLETEEYTYDELIELNEKIMHKYKKLKYENKELKKKLHEVLHDNTGNDDIARLNSEWSASISHVKEITEKLDEAIEDADNTHDKLLLAESQIEELNKTLDQYKIRYQKMVEENTLCIEKCECISRVNVELQEKLKKTEESLKSTKEFMEKYFKSAATFGKIIEEQVPNQTRGIGYQSDEDKKKQKSKGKRVVTDDEPTSSKPKQKNQKKKNLHKPEGQPQFPRVDPQTKQKKQQNTPVSVKSHQGRPTASREKK